MFNGNTLFWIVYNITHKTNYTYSFFNETLILHIREKKATNGAININAIIYEFVLIKASYIKAHALGMDID